ncbi:MAG: metallophosphoesterase family protein [Myxococcota bacterium]
MTAFSIRSSATGLVAALFVATWGCGTDGATLAVDAADAAGSDATATDGDPAALAAAFQVPELLGRPTATSIAVHLLPTADLEVQVAYGRIAGTLDQLTPPFPATGGTPLVVTLTGLQPGTAYAYHLRWRTPGASQAFDGPERAFHTQRPPGAAFRFTVQADSHLDDKSDLTIYQRTLGNVAADAPDFHLDLGDTFMCEKHSAPFTAEMKAAPDRATVDARYLYERGNFGVVTPSVPLFLVNGNHEGEAGWFLNGKPDNLAIWATQARQRLFLHPTPDGFYTGDDLDLPYVGRRGAWYAWQWGDALFVVLDPYWSTTVKTKTDGWAFTLGEPQYRWLAKTLAESKAPFRFVFLHHLVGGLDGQGRGGAEAAPFFEWGGYDADGKPAFEQKRPGWGVPIHDLLVQNRVSAVFHGHDHVYARQILDGIVYLEVPQPSTLGGDGAKLAAAYHYASGQIQGSAGHVRVSVTAEAATLEYVRAWRPQDETGQQQNGHIDDSFVIERK